jgi:hypothetical protein
MGMIYIMRENILKITIIIILLFSGCIYNNENHDSITEYDAVDSEIILISNNSTLNITQEKVSSIINKLNTLGYKTPESKTTTQNYVITIFENLGKSGKDNIGGGIYLNGSYWKECEYDFEGRNYTIEDFEKIIIIQTSYVNKDNIEVKYTDDILEKANSTYQNNKEKLKEKNSEIIGLLKEHFQVSIYREEYKMRTSSYS